MNRNVKLMSVVYSLALLLFTVSVTAQHDEILPDENLVVAGIPKIPRSLALEADRYTKGRSADLLAWHPVHRQILIATYFGNTPQVHNVKFPGGARTQLTFFEDKTSRGVSFQPTTGDYFIFSKDSGGDQNFQNYRYDLATGSITLLTDGKSRNSVGLWSTAGDSIIYASNRRNTKDLDLYIMNPSDPKSDRMLAQLSGGGWHPQDWSPDDKKILVREVISINETRLWLFDSVTGDKQLLAPIHSDEKVFYSHAHFSSDGKGIYVVTDRDSEFRRLALMNVATGSYNFLTTQIRWDVVEFEPSPDQKLLAIVANEDGITRLHVFDANTGKEKNIKGFPVGYVTGIRWHKNGNDLGFNLDSARSPTDVHSLDIRTAKVERWTFSETGGLNTSKFVEPELIHWKSFDERSISGFLYRPPSRFDGKRPVIIDIHGGPEDQFQPYFMGLKNYYTSELGIALIYPNIRGSSGYGKSFLKLDNGLLREHAYKDLETLLDWIKSRSDLDANRVMVTGFSYGGLAALTVASRFSDRICCAVDVVGPSNLVSFLESTAGYRQDLRRVEYGDERDPKVREFLQRISPLHNASKIRKPLLVIQGQNDPIVPKSESEQMIEAVRKNGVPVWYLMAKDEGHGFSKKSNSDFQFYATVLFIKEFLIKNEN